MARKKQINLTLFPEVLDVTRKFSDAQFGALMRAAFAYRLRGELYTGDDAAVDVAFQVVSNQIDRYQAYCKINSDNAKGSETEQNTAEYGETEQNAPPYPNPYPSPYPNPVLGEDMADKPPTPATAKKKVYGQYGWVKLTDDEYSRLLADLGKTEVERCIAYVDESAQSTGNKNKWRDWDLVVRKCHRDGWGKTKTQTNGRGNPMPDYGGDENWSL